MIRSREAIVLAGGFGTRLAHVVTDVPKPMAPVAGRPFLRFILDNLAENGFRRVVVADGYKRECIESYFGASYRGMELIYSSEDTPLLTGGAIKQALSFCQNQQVFVLNGDTFVDIPYGRMEEALLDSDVEVVLCAKVMENFDRYGTLEMSEFGRITSFKEKRHCDWGIINAGAYLLRANSLDACSPVFSLETDFFEQAVVSGSLAAVLTDGLFIDIGVPEDYELAQVVLASLVKKWKIAFFDRDGTINVDTGHLHEPEKLRLLPAGLELVKRYSEDPAYKVVVVTNQAGIAKGMYGVAEMRRLHDALDVALERQGCGIDAYYYCPHHPDFTGPCSCRKPASGMLERALFEFDADPENCVLYGDNPSDIQAALSAGVFGYLV